MGIEEVVQEEDDEVEMGEHEELNDRCRHGARRQRQNSDGYRWQLRTLLSRLTLFSYSAGSSFFAFRVLKST